MAEAPSPYRPGMGLEPPYLGDRDRQLERFRGSLADRSQPHNVLVIGLRGVGKTVLLHHYSQEAEDEGWLVVEREFSEADAEPDLFARTLLSDLLDLTHRLSRSKRVRDAAGRLAQSALDFLGTLSVSYSGIEVGLRGGRHPARPHRRFDDDLREAFTQVGELCRRSEHPGVMLRYDEFHAVEERRGQLTISALLAALAAVQQRGIPIGMVLCGLPALQENLARSKSYSERMFTIERLGNLRPPEDRAALIDPAVRHGRRFADEVVEAVMADTAGYPFFIQLYGDQLWKGARGQTIADRDLDRLRPEILRILDASFFESRFLRAAPYEQRLLHLIAAQGESATLEQLQFRSGWRNNQLQPALRRLTQKGLVHRPSRGNVAFAVPMFGAYLRRRAADSN
ncbi:MAG: ATP-binding protein [Candidatus Dormibacteraceae bacterium]